MNYIVVLSLLTIFDESMAKRFDWMAHNFRRQCSKGNVTAIELLMAEYGVDAIVNGRDPHNGGTCLNFASHGLNVARSLRLMDLLLRSGASPNVKDSNGKTALHYTFFYGGKVQHLRRLLEEDDVNTEVREYYGETPLRMAIKSQRPYFIEELVAHGASISNSKSARNSQRDFDDSLGNPEVNEALLIGLKRFCSACIKGETCVVEDIDNSCACQEGWVGIKCDKGVCDPGWTGTYCKQDINECLQLPCHHGGTCHNSLGSFSCACHEQIIGEYCQYKLTQSGQNGIFPPNFVVVFVSSVATLTLMLNSL